MKWHKHLLVGKSVHDSKDLRRRIERGKEKEPLYLLAAPSNEENLLDLIPVHNLRQKAYPRDDLEIFGLAGGKEEAEDLVCEIVRSAADASRPPDVRAFLRSLQEEE